MADYVSFVLFFRWGGARWSLVFGTSSLNRVYKSYRNNNLSRSEVLGCRLGRLTDLVSRVVFVVLGRALVCWALDLEFFSCVFLVLFCANFVCICNHRYLGSQIFV